MKVLGGVFQWKFEMLDAGSMKVDELRRAVPTGFQKVLRRQRNDVDDSGVIAEKKPSFFFLNAVLP